MNLWAKKDRLYIERHIQRAKKSQEKLRKWIAISSTLLSPIPSELPCPLIITLRSPFGI
jgi:hypothetical protein